MTALSGKFSKVGRSTRIAILGFVLVSALSLDQTHAFPGSGRSYTPPPLLIQSVSVVGTNNPASIATIGATGTGHLLIAGVSFFSASNCITSVTDNGSSGGNSYSLIANTNTFDGIAGNVAIFYATGSKSGATALTINNTCGAPSTLFFLEFANLSALDGTAASNSIGVNSTTVTTPTITTTTTHSVVFSVGIAGGVASGLHAGSTFTGMTITSGDDAAYNMTTTAGIYGAVFDQAPTQHYCSATAAFK